MGVDPLQCCALVFRISDNGKGPDLLRQVFLERGWVEYDKNTQDECDWNLWWQSYFRTSDYERILPWQRLNHYPKSTAITKKDGLVRNLRRMLCVHGGVVFNFSPLSFNLPNDYTKFVKVYSTLKQNAGGKGPLWICKPANLSRGRGIFIFHDLSELMYHSNSVVQQYVDNPLLVGGYKFDLRIYVAVTSFNPLIIYLYEEGIARFSTEKYDLNSTNNVFSHLTNTSINKYSPSLMKDKELVGRGCKWTVTALRQYFLENNINDWLLWRHIISIVILTVIIQVPQVPKVKNCFELYGFDILVDENLKPWLLEVNSSPSLSCDCKVDIIAKKSMLHDLIDLLNYNEQDYHRGVSHASYCQSHSICSHQGISSHKKAAICDIRQKISSIKLIKKTFASDLQNPDSERVNSYECLPKSTHTQEEKMDKTTETSNSSMSFGTYTRNSLLAVRRNIADPLLPLRMERRDLLLPLRMEKRDLLLPFSLSCQDLRNVDEHEKEKLSELASCNVSISNSSLNLRRVLTETEISAKFNRHASDDYIDKLTGRDLSEHTGTFGQKTKFARIAGLLQLQGQMSAVVRSSKLSKRPEDHVLLDKNKSILTDGVCQRQLFAINSSNGTKRSLSLNRFSKNTCDNSLDIDKFSDTEKEMSRKTKKTSLLSQCDNISISQFRIDKGPTSKMNSLTCSMKTGFSSPEVREAGSSLSTHHSIPLKSQSGISYYHHKHIKQNNASPESKSHSMKQSKQHLYSCKEQVSQVVSWPSLRKRVGNFCLVFPFNEATYKAAHGKLDVRVMIQETQRMLREATQPNAQVDTECIWAPLKERTVS